MKQGKLFLVVLVMLGMADRFSAAAGTTVISPAEAQEERFEDPHLRLELLLQDGSRLIGVPNIRSVAVETPYTKMDIPLQEIQTLTIREDHGPATFELRNGDRVTGVISIGPIGLETVFGKVTIGIDHLKLLRVMLTKGSMPPGEGSLPFGGVNWIPWRTLFEVRGDKLVSLPKVRPGFFYGHFGNGRGPVLVANIGDSNWQDYRVDFQLCLTGVDPALDPLRLPPGFRGGGVGFHLVDAKESWNECGGSGYNLTLLGDGSWTLGCTYNQYCRQSTGWGNPQNDGYRKLAEGNGLRLDPHGGNRIRIEVVGTRIQIWVDSRQIVDVRDEKMGDRLGGKTLDHGGISITGMHDCLFWIRDFSATRL